jgi:membrane protein DedA with SNARE-associated domain
MALDAVFPAASELVMLYAGALAAGAFTGERVVIFGHHVSSHPWAYVAVVTAGTIGYTLGSVAGWAVGLYGGRPFLERRGRWFHLGPERLDRAEQWFNRYDDAAVFVGRITPVARSFISIPAGVFRMPLGRYTALTFVGSTLWCLGFAGAGYGLGSSWDRFDHAFRYVEIALVVLAVAGMAWLVLKGRSNRLARRA